MKMKIFGNIIRAVRGVKNCLCGGAAKALVVTAVVLFACTAWADTWYDGSKYTWSYSIIDGDKVKIQKSITAAAVDPKPTGDFEIPSTINGKKVQQIGNGAFRGCDGLTSVTIPYGVTVVGTSAFRDCTSLEAVEIPDSVEYIGLTAFLNCTSLENVTIPDSVTEIIYSAFKGCTSLEQVKLPAALLATIDKDVVFADCPADLEISSTAVSGGLTWHFKVVDGGAEICYNNEDDEATIPPDTTKGAIAIPDTLGGLPVVSIGEEAFYECDKLTSVTIPATVTSIGEWAFSDCSSMTLTVPDTVTSIGDAAFQGCDAMADANGFVIVRGVLHHYTDKDDHVTIPSGVTRIGSRAFEGCDVESVTIPETITSIGSGAFRECKYLENCDVPASVTSIDPGAFWACESLADADGFVIVRDILCFYAGDAATVTIPGGVATVDIFAFQDNDDVKSVTIPASATHIAYAAFAQCDRLKEVTIPKSVTAIDMYAFRDIDKTWKVFLKTVHVEADDTGRVRNLLIISGHDVAGITFVEDVPAPCTVKFDANGGAVSPETRLVTKGAEIGDLPEPVREGFTFDGWFTALDGGEPISSALVMNGNATYYAHWTEIVDVAAIWYTTRAEAFAEARRTGKKVFMICGRDTCGNTMYTKNVACEDPMVKPTLVAKCVLWYTNCDTQKDENYYYWPMGEEYVLPVVCFIDPANEYGYIVRVTGLQWPGNLRSLLTHVPDPVAPDSTIDSNTIDPETIDPMNPGDLPWYKVINARDIWNPVSVSKAETLRGALYYGAEVMGIVELKLGRISKNGTSKVSGTVTTLDGKKHKIKANTLSVDSTYAGSINLEVSGLGGMDLAVGSIGGVNVFAGSLGKWHVQSANVGGNWTKDNATAVVAVGDVSAFGSGVLTDLLPTNEVAVVASGKWTFKKAASVKWAKPKADQATFTPLDAKGKGLIIDTSKDKTNFSGLKLNYTPKKGTFKGSFKVYAVQAGKVKKFTVNVNGVVVDGVGYGSATCKRPAITWPLTVR